MHVVHGQLTKSLYLNRTQEHGESVQLALIRASVISISPPFSQPFDVRERNTVLPVCGINLVWEAGVVKFTIEQGECLLWDGNQKGLLLRHSQ